MLALTISGAVDWLATFAMHSTIALGVALSLPLLLRRRAQVLQEQVLRLSMWAALLSSTLQCTVLEHLWSSRLVLAPAASPTADLVFEPTANWTEPAAATSSWTMVRDLPWPSLVVSGAVFAAMLGLGWLFTVHRRLGRVLASREPETDARVLTTAAEVACQLGLRQSPHVSRSALIATPIAFGWLRPEVCLPNRATSLSSESLRAMLAHEVAHLRRGDPAWMWLAAWLQAMFPWQPFLCLVRRRWSRLVELRCDALAAQQSSPTAVARCLVDVAEWLRPGHSEPAVALGMAARPSALRERVESVLRTTLVRAPNKVVVAAVSGLSLTALTMAAPGMVTASPADFVFEGPTDLPAASALAPASSPLPALLTLLRDEQAALAAEASSLEAELRAHPMTPDLLQMEATLRTRLSDLDRSRRRLEALVERRAPRSR